MYTSDVFQYFSCGCPTGKLLVDPSSEDGGENGVEDDVGDVEESHDRSEGADIGVDVLELGQGGLDVGGKGDITGSPTEAAAGKAKIDQLWNVSLSCRAAFALTRWG